MGYYTYHTLSVYDKEMKYLNEVTEEHELLITKAYYAEECTEPDLFNDQTKWYEHEDNMREHSIKYPNYIFRIQGEGESNDDWWRQYFHNGKMIQFNGEITFDDEFVSIEDFR